MDRLSPPSFAPSSCVALYAPPRPLPRHLELREQRPLTRSETAVARLAATGLTNEAIARARKTSVRTVANQMARVFRELRLRSRADLLTHQNFARSRPRPEPVNWAALTRREREVMGLACGGAAQKVIAHDLGLAPSSISAFLKSARLKLGFGSLVEMLGARTQALREEASAALPHPASTAATQRT